MKAFSHKHLITKYFGATAFASRPNWFWVTSTRLFYEVNDPSTVNPLSAWQYAMIEARKGKKPLGFLLTGILDYGRRAAASVRLFSLLSASTVSTVGSLLDRNLMKVSIKTKTALLLLASTLPSHSDETARLAGEVRDHGWIVFSARTDAGDWDLQAMRPDGSARFALTSTPAWNEFLPRFSPDDRSLLYRRIGKNETVDGNRHGEQGELILAASDGTSSRILAGEGGMPWATWAEDGLAILEMGGISIVDIKTGKPEKKLRRNGFFQQLVGSPDGDWLIGVSNAFGASWSVGRIHARSGESNPVSQVDCCTPDWFPDGKRIIFSNRPRGQQTNAGQGWTQLWSAAPDGSDRRLIYAEDGRHIYGGEVSPGGKHVIFTGNPAEDGDPANRGAPMAVMRLADAPVIGGESPGVRKLHADAKNGPVLNLPPGWEPSWTATSIKALAPPPAP